MRAALTATAAILLGAALAWGWLALITYIALLPLRWAAHLIGA